MTLRLDGVSVSLPHGAQLFAPVTLEVAPGQVACIMGPSGAGKSSLLDAVGGLLAPGLQAIGRVWLDGQAVSGLPAERRRIGRMFQDAMLFPHLSVGDNLAFGLPAGVKGRAARSARVDEALARAGLGGMADRDPATLSGGQRARAALMRTLLAEPRAVLLDEPFAALDAPLRADLRAFTLDHLQGRGIPAVLVTHDPADAEAAGGPVLRMGG
jgi:putative thiamine transport system ATP-binding protein